MHGNQDVSKQRNQCRCMCVKTQHRQLPHTPHNMLLVCKGWVISPSRWDQPQLAGSTNVLTSGSCTHAAAIAACCWCCCWCCYCVAHPLPACCEAHSRDAACIPAAVDGRKGEGGTRSL
jgi:hypothetical protein